MAFEKSKLDCQLSVIREVHHKPLRPLSGGWYEGFLLHDPFALGFALPCRER